MALLSACLQPRYKGFKNRTKFVPPASCPFIYLFIYCVLLCELTGRLVAMGHVLIPVRKRALLESLEHFPLRWDDVFTERIYFLPRNLRILVNMALLSACLQPRYKGFKNRTKFVPPASCPFIYLFIYLFIVCCYVN